MSKKKSRKMGKCSSCKAERVVDGVCTACGVAVEKVEKPKENGSD